MDVDILDEQISIEESFYKFFTKEILDFIKSNKHPNKKLKPFKIKEITYDEMKVFIGLVVLMGIVKLHSLRDYWSEDSFIATLPFRFYIGRDRFIYILRFLHVFDSKQIPSDNKDPLIRARLFSELLKRKCQENAALNRELTVDEIIIPSKGRCKFKQYIKNKRHRFGMKVWALCDSTSCYIHNFNFYTGKEEGVGSKNLTEKVVTSLVKDLKSTNHEIFMDAFFTSVPLFD
jgi:hypothetical protein